MTGSTGTWSRRRQPEFPVVGANDLEGRRLLLLDPADNDEDLEEEDDDEVIIKDPDSDADDEEEDNGDDEASAAETLPCDGNNDDGRSNGSGPGPRTHRWFGSEGVQLLLIHCDGWLHRWEEWIRSDSERLRPFRTRTCHSPAPRRREFYSGFGVVGGWRSSSSGGKGGARFTTRAPPRSMRSTPPRPSPSRGREGGVGGRRTEDPAEDEDDGGLEERTRLVAELARAVGMVQVLLDEEAVAVTSAEGRRRSRGGDSDEVPPFDRRRQSLLPWRALDEAPCRTVPRVGGGPLVQAEPEEEAGDGFGIDSCGKLGGLGPEGPSPLPRPPAGPIGPDTDGRSPHMAALAENLPPRRNRRKSTTATVARRGGEAKAKDDRD